MLEQFFMKCKHFMVKSGNEHFLIFNQIVDVWSGTGMIMISLPILTTTDLGKSPENVANKHYSKAMRVSDRTQYLTTARNLLISG